MGRTHYWFATEKDVPQIWAWLTDAGAVPLTEQVANGDFSSQHDTVLHFPALGRIEFLPEKIDASVHKEGSLAWKRAILAKRRQQENPGVSLIDDGKSPVASLFGSYQRDRLFWTTGELHFTTPNLDEKFPGLGKICSRFGKWLSKNELVFDHASREFTREPFNPFGYNLGIEAGFVRKIYALPNALTALKSDAVMIDRQMSDERFDRFKRTLRLRGIEC